MYDISEVVEMTGIQAPTLRIWELRYGWPLPKRGANHYRMYSPHQVELLREVARLLEEGRSIGEILGDHRLRIKEGILPVYPSQLRKRPTYDFSGIPSPSTPAAKELRAQLEEAIIQGDMATVALITAQACRLRPADREAAVDAPLRLLER